MNDYNSYEPGGCLSVVAIILAFIFCFPVGIVLLIIRIAVISKEKEAADERAYYADMARKREEEERAKQEEQARRAAAAQQKQALIDAKWKAIYDKFLNLEPLTDEFESMYRKELVSKFETNLLNPISTLYNNVIESRFQDKNSFEFSSSGMANEWFEEGHFSKWVFITRWLSVSAKYSENVQKEWNEKGDEMAVIDCFMRLPIPIRSTEENVFMCYDVMAEEYKGNQIKIQNRLNEITNMDLQSVDIVSYVKIMAEFLWLYALSNPIQLNEYNQVKDKLNFIYMITPDGKHKAGCIDVILADLYIAKLLNGKVPVSQELQEWVAVMKYFTKDGKILRKEDNLFNPFYQVAKALKTLQLYKNEEYILETMLSSGITLDNDLVQRLQFIKNIGEDIKNIYDIRIEDGKLPVDYSSMNWNIKDFESLIQTLTLQSKALSYAMAIRDWSKNLLINQNGKFDKNDAYTDITKMLLDEYMDSIICENVKIIVLSDDGTQTEKDGLLVRPVQDAVGFDFIGMCLSVSGFGKNLTLRIDTVYYPKDNSIDKQKQQIFTLKNKSNPDITSFEESIQSSILKGMEAFLNGESNNDEKMVSTEEVKPSESNEFF